MNNPPAIVRMFNSKASTIELYFSCYHWYLIEEEYDRLILYYEVKPKYFDVQELNSYIEDICQILEADSWADLSVVSFKLNSPNDEIVINVVIEFLKHLLDNKKCDCQTYIPV